MQSHGSSQEQLREAAKTPMNPPEAQTRRAEDDPTRMVLIGTPVLAGALVQLAP